MKLRLSRQAKADIGRIYLESARAFGIHQADSYQSGLRESLGIIGAHPELARERSNFTRPVRVHPYEAHVIVYLLDDKGVLILRILHAHQKLRRIL